MPLLLPGYPPPLASAAHHYRHSPKRLLGGGTYWPNSPPTFRKSECGNIPINPLGFCSSGLWKRWDSDPRDIRTLLLMLAFADKRTAIRPEARWGTCPPIYPLIYAPIAATFPAGQMRCSSGCSTHASCKCFHSLRLVCPVCHLLAKRSFVHRLGSLGVEPRLVGKGSKTYHALTPLYFFYEIAKASNMRP